MLEDIEKREQAFMKFTGISLICVLTILFSLITEILTMERDFFWWLEKNVANSSETTSCLESQLEVKTN